MNHLRLDYSFTLAKICGGDLLDSTGGGGVEIGMLTPGGFLHDLRVGAWFRERECVPESARYSLVSFL